MRNQAIILAACLLAAGCRVPDYEPAALPAFMNDGMVAAVPLPEPSCARRVADATAPASVVTLPDAIEQCVLTNLRIQAGREKVQQARAELISDSLIPNPQ